MDKVNIKLLIWGPPNSGKSRFALLSPKPLVIDPENSTNLYAKDFIYMWAKIDKTKNNKDYCIDTATNLTNQIIKEINNNEYEDEIETLIIDPLTDLLNDIERTLCYAYEKIIGKNVLELNALQKTKWYAYRREGVRKILDAMINLPLNIIWICREKDIWGPSKDGMVPIGKTYDGHEIIESLVDFVINLNIKGEPTVTKTRGFKYDNSFKIKSWNDIVDLIKSKKNKNLPTGKTKITENILKDLAMKKNINIETFQDYVLKAYKITTFEDMKPNDFDKLIDFMESDKSNSTTILSTLEELKKNEKPKNEKENNK